MPGDTFKAELTPSRKATPPAQMSRRAQPWMPGRSLGGRKSELPQTLPAPAAEQDLRCPMAPPATAPHAKHRAAGSSPKQQQQARDQAGNKLWKALPFKMAIPSLPAAVQVVGAEHRAGIKLNPNKVLGYRAASSFLSSIMPCKLEPCRYAAYRSRPPAHEVSQVPEHASPAPRRSSADGKAGALPRHRHQFAVELHGPAISYN